MYWNVEKGESKSDAIKININMRCIEITDNPTYIRLLYRLTLTWDVLKSKDLATLTQGKKININMRCIEIPLMKITKVVYYD